MADKLIINGLGKQFDGDYEFSIAAMLVMGTTETLTNGELHTIKRISGVRAGEIEEAIMAGDNDVLLALALIVLGRNGKRLPEHLMWDAPAGSGIQLIPDEGDGDESGEGDAGPPELSPTENEPNEPNETLETNGGSSSSQSSDSHPQNDPSPTGSQHSETPTSAPVSGQPI
jgi:hypothetical protein